MAALGFIEDKMDSMDRVDSLKGARCPLWLCRLVILMYMFCAIDVVQKADRV